MYIGFIDSTTLRRHFQYPIDIINILIDTGMRDCFWISYCTMIEKRYDVLIYNKQRHIVPVMFMIIILCFSFN